MVSYLALIALLFRVAEGILSLIGRTVNALYVTSRPEAISLTPGVIALGAGLLFFGKSRFDADALVPRRTLNSLREDEAWIRDQFS